MTSNANQEGDGPALQPVTLEGFRAELEVFSGPLDLLFYLVKQAEVSIFEVQVSRVTERYLAALRTMEFFDVNVAADFLVVAATLMEIKSRTLLPPSHDEDEEEEDPGAELVRHLLQYKEIKETAEGLSERAREQNTRFPRPPSPLPGGIEEAPPEALLEDLTTWDLMAAFSEVVEQTRLAPPAQIVRSDVPVSVYVAEVVEHLRAAAGPVDFLDFFRHERSRERIIGVFLALLELCRRKVIHVEEDRSEGRRIRVSLGQAPERHVS